MLLSVWFLPQKIRKIIDRLEEKMVEVSKFPKLVPKFQSVHFEFPNR